MAKYNIIGLNYMSSGAKRGLFSLTLQLDYSMRKHVNLLGMTKENGEQTSFDPSGHRLPDGKGIMTESGSYRHINTEVIGNYPQQDSISALAHNGDILVANEQQLVPDYSSLSVDWRTSDEPGSLPLSVNPPKAIRLVSEDDMYDTSDISNVVALDDKYQKFKCVYEFEKSRQQNIKTIYTDDLNRQVLPLNDIVDVSIKQRYKKAELNAMVPKNIGQKQQDISENKNIDIYYSVEAEPVGFCQCENNAYMLTQPTSNGPYYLKTSLQQVLENGGSQESYGYQLSSEDIDTFLYKAPSDYGCQTYKEVFDAYPGLMKQENMASVFTPKRCIKNLQYNFIINVDQNGSASAKDDNSTDYDDGNTFGAAFTAKNAYDPEYGVRMSSISSFNSCRTYCGIQSSQRKVLLKYYDDIGYDAYDLSSQSDLKEYHAVKRDLYGGKKPYQKVEYYFPQYSYEQTRHKSNLFSIDIRKSGLNSASSDRQYSDKALQLFENIKRDISNNVREIAVSICPANTQLFKVYFQE